MKHYVICANLTIRLCFVIVRKENRLMDTWMFMMGLQVIIFVICGVWVGVWMHKDNDEYDEALERISKENLGHLKQEQ